MAARLSNSRFQMLTSMVNNAFQTVRSFMRHSTQTELCSICAAGVDEDHEHLIEPLRRNLICVCNGCAMLFGADGIRYKRVARRIRPIEGIRMTDAQWDALMIPINLAFFFKSSPANKMVALYPSAGGPIESLLSLERWEEIVGDNPALKTMEPDVEALLVNRASGDNYLLPINKCFELVGLIRTHRRGLSGESEVWERIGQFFAGLKREHA